MTNTPFMRKKLRAGTALQALALLGAGVVASAAFVAPASAQDYQNVTASGRVQGTNGKPIAGATVQLHSNDQGFDRSVTTDGAGAFRVAQLPPGNYTFTVAADGYDTFTDNNVAITRDQSGNQFTLASTGATAPGDIVVTAGRTKIVNFESATTGSVISVSDLATRVPVSRSLRDVILLAPGTIQGGSGQNSSFANQATIGGSAFSENAYYVNGLNVTEFRQGFSPVTIPFDFYDTVNVQTGGFAAEFGRATGGVVVATTKSGSNDFHASALFNFEPNALTGDSPNTYAADNDGDYHQRIESIFQVSGPIIKDHLFFYGLYNTRSITDKNGSTSGSASVQHTTSPFWGGKADAFLWGQHLEFTYFDTSGVTHNQTYNYDPDTNKIGDYTAGNTARYGGANYVGRYTGTLTDWLTVSAAYGVNKNRAGTLPLDLVNPEIVENRQLDANDDRGAHIVPGSNTSNSVTTNEDKREFYRGDVDVTVHLIGSHHFRFGYDHEKLTSTQITNPIGGGLIQYFTASGTDKSGLPAGTDYLTQRYFQNGGAFNTINTAYYAEDSWSLFNDQLTLNLGIRNDRFDNKDAANHSFYKSGNQWGPRLAFTLDPFGTGRTKIYGSFGRYFLPIASNTNIRSAGAETDYTSYFYLNNTPVDSAHPTIGAPVLTLAGARPCPDTGVVNCTVIRQGEVADPSTLQSKNLKPQSEDEYILGFEQRLGQRMKVGVSYTYRKLGKVLEDAAIDQAALTYCEAQPDTRPGKTGNFSAADCGALFGGFSQYVLLNPGFDADITLAGEGGSGPGLPDGTNPTVHFTAEQLGYPKAARTYKAMTFTFDREFDGVWSFSGSYTLAASVGNYEGGVKSDIGQTDEGATEDFDQPGFTVGSYGYLPNHRRHTIKAFGSYQLTDWLTIGANAIVQSPKKFGCIGVVPDSVDKFAGAYDGGGWFCAEPTGQVDSNGKPVYHEVLHPRGRSFESDWRKEIDLTFLLKVPVDFDASVRVDIFNILNDKSALDFNEVGDLTLNTPDPTYGEPLVYQAARSARIQLKIGF